MLVSGCQTLSIELDQVISNSDKNSKNNPKLKMAYQHAGTTKTSQQMQQEPLQFGTIPNPRALHLMLSVKVAYANTPDVYIEFISLLYAAQRNSLPLSVLKTKVDRLFCDQPMLIDMFNQFLPLQSFE